MFEYNKGGGGGCVGGGDVTAIGPAVWTYLQVNKNTVQTKLKINVILLMRITLTCIFRINKMIALMSGSTVHNFKFKPPKKSTLTLDESAALANPQKRDDVVVRPADRGDAVVVWGRQLYIEPADKQLDNSTKYLKLSNTTLLIDQREVPKTVNDFILNQT